MPVAFERRILTNYDASTVGFDRGTRRVESQLARLQRTTDNRLSQIDRRFQRAGRAALRFATALGAVSAGLGVNAVRRYAEAWRNAERQLTAAGAAVEGNREKLARLAVRVRGDFEATSGAVARFARVTGDGIDQSIRRVETLQKLLAVGGASQGERRSAVLQLTQGLRSGQLGGEELRAIREAAPIEFLDALAARAGGTRAELKQLGADAKLTSDVIKGALDDLAATADERFSQLAITGSEAAEILGTGFSVFFGRLDEQFGATAGINQFLADTGKFLAEDAEAAATFAKALEVAAVAAGSLAGGKALGAVNRALVEGRAARQAAVAQSQALVAATTAEVQKQRELVVARGQAFATAQRTARTAAQLEKAKRSLVVANNGLIAAEGRAAAATRALTVAQGNLSAATRITTRAMNTLRAAFNFFGGVPGLILAAASAAFFLSDAFEDQADRLENLEGKLSDVEGGLSRVRQIEQDLERDTEALKAANERLTVAIDNQGLAAENTARLEIDAINRRIAKNKELQAVIERGIRADLAVAEADLAGEQEAFQRSQGRLSRAEIERIAGGRPRFDPAVQADLQAAAAAAALERRAAITALQDAEKELDPDDVEFLRIEGELAKVEARAISLRDALNELGKPVETADVGAGGGGASADGGGGRASATKEQTDALQELIAASDQRAFQLLDEIQITKAAADEVAFLEEKQRLLNAAQEAGLAITPELLGTIDGLARSYADISTELDNLRAAQEVVNQVRESSLTTEDRILRANERLAQLLPAIIELTGDRAEAERILTQAQEDAAERIRQVDRDQGFDQLADGISRAITEAESLRDALDNVLAKLVEIALQAAITSAFSGGNAPTGGGANPLNSFFNSIFSGVFHKGGVVGQSAVPQRQVPAATFLGAPRMHSGGIAGLRPNEVPAILEKGEIVVPKDIGMGRGGNSVTVEGSTIVLQGSDATPEELERVLDRRDRRLVEQIIRMNDRNPEIFHT